MRDADASIAELERAWRADPDGEAFAALAELYRRAGRLAEAAHVVRQGLAPLAALAARAARCSLLVLADAGQAGEARRLLESWAGAALEGEAAPLRPDASDALAADVSDLEFERAFEAAETELASMITPDSVAEEATLFADGAEALRSPLESGGAFATRTMAELLERQGDRRGAARIRAALGDSEIPERAAAGARNTPLRSRRSSAGSRTCGDYSHELPTGPAHHRRGVRRRHRRRADGQRRHPDRRVRDRPRCRRARSRRTSASRASSSRASSRRSARQPTRSAAAP